VITCTIAMCTVKNTHDDGQRNCPKHVEFHSKNKFEKLVNVVGFIITNWYHMYTICRFLFWFAEESLRPDCSLDPRAWEGPRFTHVSTAFLVSVHMTQNTDLSKTGSVSVRRWKGGCHLLSIVRQKGDNRSLWIIRGGVSHPCTWSQKQVHVP